MRRLLSCPRIWHLFCPTGHFQLEAIMRCTGVLPTKSQNQAGEASSREKVGAGGGKGSGVVSVLTRTNISTRAQRHNWDGAGTSGEGCTRLKQWVCFLSVMSVLSWVTSTKSPFSLRSGTGIRIFFFLKMYLLLTCWSSVLEITWSSCRWSLIP